jgi:hypothetical protein
MTDDDTKRDPSIPTPPGGVVPGAPPGTPGELPPSVSMEETLKWFENSIKGGSDEPGMLDSDDHLGD